MVNSAHLFHGGQQRRRVQRADFSTARVAQNVENGDIFAQLTALQLSESVLVLGIKNYAAG